MGGLFHEGAAQIAIGMGHTEAANSAAQEAHEQIGDLLGPVNQADGLVKAVATVYSGAEQSLGRASDAQQAVIRGLNDLSSVVSEAESAFRSASTLLPRAAGLRTAQRNYSLVASRLGDAGGPDAVGTVDLVSAAGTESYRATTAYRAALGGHDPDEVVPKSNAQNMSVEDAQGAVSLAADMAEQDAGMVRELYNEAKTDMAASAALQQRAAKLLARSLALQREAEEIAAEANSLREQVGRRRERLAQLSTREGDGMPQRIAHAEQAVGTVVQNGLNTLEGATTTQQRMSGGSA